MRVRVPVFAILAMLLATSAVAQNNIAIVINYSPPAVGPDYAPYEVVTVNVTFCSPTGTGLFDGAPSLSHNGSGSGLPFGSGTLDGCDDYGEINGTITLTGSGDNVLEAVANATGGWGTSTAHLYVGPPPPPPPPIITHDANPSVVSPASGVRHRFRVSSNDGSGETVSFSVVCTGVASGCSVAPSGTANINGTPLDVFVTYSVSGSFGQTGYITLLTTRDAEVFRDSVLVSIAPNAVAVARGQCLTVSLAPGVAFECGDLRIVHALPATRTMNRERAPTLIYNTQHARPTVLMHGLFVTGSQRPDSVRATLRVGGVQGIDTWPKSNFPANSTRRIGVAVYVSTLPTGVYAESLEVGRWDAGQYTVVRVDTGTAVVVNRDGSAFGRGWWLAGYDTLRVLPDSSRLWIGGDGSVRQYVAVGADVWIARPLDRPDTLRRRNGPIVEYYLVLPDGDSVVFRQDGSHARTVNRLGHRTTFTLSGGKLTQIRLPTADTSIVRAYTFTYGSSAGRLSQVAAPTPPGGPSRTVTMTHSSSGTRLATITDPGLPAVSFGYDSQHRITSRTDRRGKVSSFVYQSGSKLRTVTRSFGIVTTFTVADVRGIASVDHAAVRLDSIFTRIAGPRSVNRTTFWHHELGGVRIVRDALGAVTTIDRGDPRWPVLPSRVQGPSGQVIGAVYDGRGNLAQMIDSSVTNGVRYGGARYEWHPLTSVVTRIIPAEWDSSVIAYDSSGRRRLWQQDASGAGSRVSFGYNAVNQVIAVTPPGATGGDSVFYDSLGNVARARTPLGFIEHYDSDWLGRVWRTRSPADSTQSVWREQIVVFNAAGRDSLTITRGGADSVVVRTFYNPEGQADSVQRWAAPDRADIDTITTRWTYDDAGRATIETAPDGVSEQRGYDEAGNLTVVVTRRGQTITMQYDSLNRLVQRVVPEVSYDSDSVGIAATNHDNNGVRTPYPWFPTHTNPRRYVIGADTSTFTYDAAGNLRSARNSAARVMRGYALDGVLMADTLIIEPWIGSSDTLHRYVTTYGYDLNRRRTFIRHPAQLAPYSAAVNDTVKYVYNNRGLLSDVYDLQRNRFEFQYDVRGRRTAIVFASGGLTRSWTYDADDRILTESVANARYDTVPAVNRHHVPSPMLQQRSFSYNDPGRVYRARNAAGWNDTSTSTYNPLGQLTRLIYKLPRYYIYGPPGATMSDESLTTDALGNVTQTITTSTMMVQLSHQTTSAPRSSYYFRGTGRLGRTVQGTRIDSMRYDAAGNLYLSFTAVIGSGSREDRISYYGADGQLRASESRTAPSYPYNIWQGVMEEYRYDALGRRVLVRTQRHCPNAPWYQSCRHSTMRRTVWDGNHELWEIQAPGHDTLAAYWENDTTRLDLTVNPGAYYDINRNLGRVGYTHAGTVDQPLSLTRFAYSDVDIYNFSLQAYPPFTIVPMWNWRGHAEWGAFADSGTGMDGAGRRCTSLQATRCVVPRWFAGGTAFMGMTPTPPSDTGLFADAWIGTLVSGKDDGTGTMYRRNRYLDPSTGRFTQEDPIGLAGGLNLYGFAGGDPVTFSDPFGLCPKDAADGSVCLDFFIAGKSELGFRGDNRPFDPNASPDRSRLQVVADRAGHVVWAQASESCHALSGCSPAFGINTFGGNHVSSAPDGAGGFTVSVRAYNSAFPLGAAPGINASVTFRADGSTSGNRDAFPNLGVYRRVNGEWQALQERPGKTSLSLLPMAPNDKW